MSGRLRVGAARATVTPSRTGPLAGYIARGEAHAVSTLDDLEASVVVLDDGSAQLVWVALDAVAVTERLTRELERIVTRIAGRAVPVVFAASHTHSGPAHWLGELAPGHVAALDEAAVSELLVRLELAVAVAWRDRVPAEASWSEPTVRGLASRRAYLDAAVDVTVGVLTLAVDDRVTAIIVDVPCHATVLGPDNLSWSADWPGALRRELRRRHPDAVVAFLDGASGDLSTRFTRREASPAEAERLGALTADAVLTAIPWGVPVGPRLSVHDADLALPAALRDPAAARARLADAEERRAAADEDTASVLQSVVDGARIELAVAERPVPDPVEATARLVRLGHVTWIALPFEVFSSTAQSLADQPGPVRLIGCAGPYQGYLPDAAAYADDTYEARTARVSPQAEPSARAQLRVALSTLDHTHPVLEHS